MSQMWERELHGPVFISALEESSEIDGSPTGRSIYGMDSGKPLAQVRNHKYPQTECWKNFTKDKQGQSTEGHNKTSFESKTFFFSLLTVLSLPSEPESMGESDRKAKAAATGGRREDDFL